MLCSLDAFHKDTEEFLSGRRTVSAFWYVEWLWLSFNASGLE
jgi:hypothetical protein